MYATPMLRMHHGAQGFPLALYGWSLRCRPYAAAVDARWQITIPQRSFARHTVESGPNATLTEVLQAAGIATNSPDKPLSPSTSSGQRLFAFASIGVNANDQAHLETGGIANAGITMPWGRRSKASSAPDFVPLEDLPEYFRGDE